MCRNCPTHASADTTSASRQTYDMVDSDGRSVFVVGPADAPEGLLQKVFAQMGLKPREAEGAPSPVNDTELSEGAQPISRLEAVFEAMNEAALTLAPNVTTVGDVQVLRFAVPGIPPEKLKVELVDGATVLEVQACPDKPTDDWNYPLIKEAVLGKEASIDWIVSPFKIRLELEKPMEVVSAEHQYGVLTVRVKEQESKGTVVQVQVK